MLRHRAANVLSIRGAQYVDHMGSVGRSHVIRTIAVSLSPTVTLVLVEHFDVGLPDLQVVLWHDDRATPCDISTGTLAVAMRVISLPQVLVGCTLSEMIETSLLSVSPGFSGLR